MYLEETEGIKGQFWTYIFFFCCMYFRIGKSDIETERYTVPSNMHPVMLVHDLEKSELSRQDVDQMVQY